MPRRSNDGPHSNAAVLGEHVKRAPRGCGFFCWLNGKRTGRVSAIETNTPKDDDMTSRRCQLESPTCPQPPSLPQDHRRHRRAARRGCRRNFPFGAHVAQAAGPEVTKAILGYIALMDASPLVIAKEKGLFAKHGLPDVEVVEAGLVGRDARQHRARRARRTASTARTS